MVEGKYEKKRTLAEKNYMETIVFWFLIWIHVTKIMIRGRSTLCIKHLCQALRLMFTISFTSPTSKKKTHKKTTTNKKTTTQTSLWIRYYYSYFIAKGLGSEHLSNREGHSTSTFLPPHQNVPQDLPPPVPLFHASSLANVTPSLRLCGLHSLFLPVLSPPSCTIQNLQEVHRDQKSPEHII